MHVQKTFFVTALVTLAAPSSYYSLHRLSVTDRRAPADSAQYSVPATGDCARLTSAAFTDTPAAGALAGNNQLRKEVLDMD